MANAVVEKSEDFAVRIINLYKYLTADKREFVLSKQLLRSGTSIGANIAEAHNAQSNADFAAKLHISLKECAESRYWLRLLWRTEFLTDDEFNSIVTDANELYALLTVIIKRVKENS